VRDAPRWRRVHRDGAARRRIALEAAHKNGIVHRDLKPDNVFLVKDPAVPGGERIKVLDFGIAKLHHQATSVHTQTNEVFGTPRYMSPEQCRSSTQIDQRSDIYTLGCILFELLTGRPPFVGQTGELFAQHLMVEAPSVLTFVKETPYHVADLVARMLAKDVEARPQSMADVQRELELSSGITAGVPPTLPPGVSGHMPPSASGHLPPPEADSTLKAAAGMSIMTEPMAKTPRALIAAAAGIAILLAVALVIWLRGSGERTTTVAAAVPDKGGIKVEPIEGASNGAVKSDGPASNIAEASNTGASNTSAPNTGASNTGTSNTGASNPGASNTASNTGASNTASNTGASNPGASRPDDPRASKRDQRNAKRAEKAAADKLAADQRAADKAAADKLAADKRVADKAVAKPVDPKLKTVNPFEKTPAATTPAVGTLVLRSNPPCEILVDGKAIAASTPHELKLSAGKHRITLVQDEHDIKDSFTVEIKAGGTERVNRDLHEKIKAKKRNATINPFGGS
jgi:serine/threonine protein kinase